MGVSGGRLTRSAEVGAEVEALSDGTDGIDGADGADGAGTARVVLGASKARVVWGASKARVVLGASLWEGTASDPEEEPSVTARSGSMPWE